MYGKFFSSTFTGSMFGAGADVFAVWGYVIANTVESTVELNPKLLSAILGTPIERVESAIEFLCSPDTASRNHEEDGRRLLKQGPFQYFVVSHKNYRAIKNEDDRREYNRVKMRESRERKRQLSNQVSLTVNHSDSQLPVCAHTEAENTEAKKQKPSRVKRERATKTAIADERHATFKEAIKRYWDSKNPGIDMPWGPAEGQQLGMWLREAPHITLDQFTVFLRNRYKSDCNHGERPCQWIKWITSYGPGPTDRFKNTAKEDDNGASKPSPAKQRIDNNRRAIAEAALNLGWISPDDLVRKSGQAVPDPRSDRDDSGVHEGLRSAGPEILPPAGRGGSSGTPR